MSRVLFPAGATWYDELKAVAYYGETDLEREIRQHLKSLFPDFYVFPFKRDVVSRRSLATKRPDLGMVRRDLSGWGVIEVELSEHDLDHVLDQTTCFATGDYNAPETAEYVQRQLKTHCEKKVSIKRLRNLISTELPKVLVITDAPIDDWQQPLRAVP